MVRGELGDVKGVKVGSPRGVGINLTPWYNPGSIGDTQTDGPASQAMSKRRPAGPTPPEPKPEPDQPESPGHHLALDRFEEARDGGKLAVLVTDDGHSFTLPRSLLPEAATAGMTLYLTLSLDPVTTAEVTRNVAQIRSDLKRTDPGGTIQL